MATQKTGTEPGEERRRRGRRPGDAAERRAHVLRAIADLEGARVPFTMADLAERAGISRATLYRDAGLRDLVGGKGDGPASRPVNGRDFDALRTRVDALGSERRTLRRQLREAEARVKAADARAESVETDYLARERAARARMAAEDAAKGDSAVRKEAYTEGFAAGVRAAASHRGGAGPTPGATGGNAARNGGGGTSSAELLAVATRLPKASLLAARRTLAQKLHPDLFAKDPAAALLATELLKQINALAGGTPG